MGEIRGGRPQTGLSSKNSRADSSMVAKNAVLDGNSCVQDANRTTSFSLNLGVTPPTISECPDIVRSVRIKILDGIVGSLERKRPGWQKGRILHLSTQLEESMFLSQVSLADFGDLGTLETRIHEHCFLLAKLKQAERSSPDTADGDPLSLSLPGEEDVTTLQWTTEREPQEASPLQNEGEIEQSVDSSESMSAVSTISAVSAVSQVGIIAEPEIIPLEGISPSGQKILPLTEAELSSSSSSCSCSSSSSSRKESPARSDDAHCTLLTMRCWCRCRCRCPCRPPTHASTPTIMRPMMMPMHPGNACHECYRSSSGRPRCVAEKDGQRKIACEDRMPADKTINLIRLHEVADDDNDDDDVRKSVPGLGGATLEVVVDGGYKYKAQNATGKDHPYGVEDHEPDRDGHLSGQHTGKRELAERPWAPSIGEMLKECAEVASVRSDGCEGTATSSSKRRLSGTSRDAKWTSRPNSRHAGVVNKQDSREARQHALRLFQCRVFLLRHGSSCTEAIGACQLSPLCDSVRQLLQHIQGCRKRSALECDFPHCSSSKAMLHHQYTCRDSFCHLCGSVRELSQKCFWANARHAHKRRLQESQEERRKKRLQEGKVVPPPRKQQADRKGARGHCVGLDEAGNCLGDISLGFFLRQDRAVKARKLAEGSPRPSPSPGPSPGSFPKKQKTLSQPVTSTFVDAVPGAARLPSVPSTGDIVDLLAPQPKEQARKAFSEESSRRGGSAAYAPPLATWASKRLPSERHQGSIDPHPKAVHDSDLGHTTLPVACDPGVSVSASASVSARASVRASAKPPLASPCARVATRGRRHEGEESFPKISLSDDVRDVRKAVLPKGRSVSIVPHGGSITGRVRTPSGFPLEEIADSLKDYSREPSLAKIQSLQAFIEQQEDLRESPSFGDVYTLLDQWSSLEDVTAEDEQLVLSSPLSF